MEIIRSIQNRIYEIRGQRVMLDFDLAKLYDVETKVLNQAVKRNVRRFPNDFMFRLSQMEWDLMRSQIVTAYSDQLPLRSHIVTLKVDRRNIKQTPYAFTEQGIAMLSGVLNSDKAIKTNIAIMRAFVELRRLLIHESGLTSELLELKRRIGEHDIAISQIYDAIENILDENIAKKKWESRERIGFKK